MTPQTIQNIKIGAAATVGLGLLYLVIGKKTDNSGGTDDPTGNGGFLPQTVFNAKQIADDLYNEMAAHFTSSDKLLEILKYVNAKQYVQVRKAFGLRAYNAIMGDNRIYIPFTHLPLEGLKVWLENEMSDLALSAVKKKFGNL